MTLTCHDSRGWRLLRDIREKGCVLDREFRVFRHSPDCSVHDHLNVWISGGLPSYAHSSFWAIAFEYGYLVDRPDAWYPTGFSITTLDKRALNGQAVEIKHPQFRSDCLRLFLRTVNPALLMRSHGIDPQTL